MIQTVVQLVGQFNDTTIIRIECCLGADHLRLG